MEHPDFLLDMYAFPKWADRLPGLLLVDLGLNSFSMEYKAGTHGLFVMNI